MPYKDLEKRRACSRESKRRARVRLAYPECRAYICLHQPSIRIGPGVHFENGFFLTTRPELQNMVETNLEYGRHIFRLALVLDLP